MSKYIIKNCPCYVQYENSLHLCCDGQGDGECQDCTDCVMKQIVELCKRTCEMRYTNYCLGAKKYYGYGQILKLLDIQEVE